MSFVSHEVTPQIFLELKIHSKLFYALTCVLHFKSPCKISWLFCSSANSQLRSIGDITDTTSVFCFFLPAAYASPSKRETKKATPKRPKALLVLHVANPKVYRVQKLSRCKNSPSLASSPVSRVCTYREHIKNVPKYTHDIITLTHDSHRFNNVQQETMYLW